MTSFLPTMNDAMVLRLLKQALRTLSDRLLTIVVFLATCGAGAYAMILPNCHRDAVVLFFGILYVITLNRERRPRDEQVPGTESTETFTESD